MNQDEQLVLAKAFLQLASQGQASETLEVAREATQHPLIGRRVLVRTHTSGVSIGILESVTIDGGMVTVELAEAVRIWQWEKAFTCSELATKGGECRVAIHPEIYTTTEQGAEILLVHNSAWDNIKDNWSVGAR